MGGMREKNEFDTKVNFRMELVSKHEKIRTEVLELHGLFVFFLFVLVMLNHAETDLHFADHHPIQARVDFCLSHRFFFNFFRFTFGFMAF
jgi:hypothetical protein